MLGIGQIIITPVGGTHNDIRTVENGELGGFVGFSGGTPLIVFGTFTMSECRGASHGDYMAVAGETKLVLHIRKTLAEQWARHEPAELSAYEEAPVDEERLDADTAKRFK